ncbi:MATE family efflux transporter [Pseudohalocynthiibacter aestuariivivens]|jgi:MATE family, multidrug efflux pump|uniref:Multidrug-efflux transporter n=1 Tax=Pseudohalocynthiibacter aestuariivivens TaxID=1591409 RepID=A0ABV5JAH3_9RHOB|nr:MULTISPECIES: MATE family efflux transporter [Pseudohalocynthiibacter]MBS9715986.1 MATE family efflux transporter [Pseudohalocynthiibacter aestuariivivens]MCK0102457.1 MATE family efflux transporter [Pseudohalocynthiibacter sp. F2068]
MSTPSPYREDAKKLLVLGFPLILSNLAQMAITVTDTIMLGWYSIEALASITLMGTMIFLFFIVGSGFAFAVMPLVAEAAQRSDDVHIRRVTRMGMWLSVLYFFCIVSLLFWSETLLTLLGQDPEISAIAQSYSRIAAWGTLGALLVMVLQSYLSALELTKVVLWATISAAVMNGFANYVLIFGNWGAPELGVRGAAIASVLSVLVSLVFLSFYAVYKKPEHALFQRVWRPDWEAMGTVFRLGWPIGMTSLAETGLFAATSVMMGWIGKIPLAAHGIALQLSAITFMVHVGLSNAATVRAGRALGRKDEAGLRQGAKVAISMSVTMAILTIILFLSLPEFLIGLFLDSEDPERGNIVAVGAGLLAVAAVFQFADGAQVMGLSLLRGVQDTRVPMIYAAVSYWLIGMPASYILGFKFDFGGVGIWAGLVCGLAVAGMFMMARFWGRSVRIGAH